MPWSRLVETMGLEPTTPACKALRGVRASACQAVAVQVAMGGATAIVRTRLTLVTPVWLPYWLPGDVPEVGLLLRTLDQQPDPARLSMPCSSSWTGASPVT
jgi:hypothetical protein